MRFLITGGAGFIGSNIAEKLISQGHFVRILDNFSSGRRENFKFTKWLGKSKFELIKGDIRNQADCNRACQGIDYVLHQAALRSVPKSMQDPQSYNEVNIKGTLFMLKAAAKNKVKRFHHRHFFQRLRKKVEESPGKQRAGGKAHEDVQEAVKGFCAPAKRYCPGKRNKAVCNRCRKNKEKNAHNSKYSGNPFNSFPIKQGKNPAYLL